VVEVIVLGGHVNALGVIRSYGITGKKPIVLFYEKNDFAYKSKYAKEVHYVSDPNVDEKGFIDFLLNKKEQWKGAIIVPTNDRVLLPVSKYKKELEEYYIVACPDYSIVDSFVHKEQTYPICDILGIPYAKTYNEKDLVNNTIDYPVVIKPNVSHLFVEKFNKKLFVCNNKDELTRKILLCRNEGHGVSVQELIEGTDKNIVTQYIYVNSKGALAASFFIRKVRQTPPRFGQIRVGKSESKIQELDAYTKKFVQYTGFKGVGSFAYKKDDKDGKYKFLECNVRFHRSIWFQTCQGINIPDVLYKDLVEHVYEYPEQNKVGIYYVEIYADLVNFFLRDWKENWGFRDYLKPYFSRKCFGVLNKKDMKPFIFQFLLLPKKSYLMVKKGIKRFF